MLQPARGRHENMNISIYIPASMSSQEVDTWREFLGEAEEFSGLGNGR